MRTVFLSALVLAWCAAADAKPKKGSQDLRELKAGEVADVIVTFRTKPSDKHHDKVRQNGGKVKLTFQNIDAAVYQATAAALEELDKDSDVDYITPDRAVHGALDYADTSIRASAAWNLNYWGYGVGVAVIDSGISSHPDLDWWTAVGSSRIAHSKNFVSGETATNDLYGHGTHVAGIIAGTGNLTNNAQSTMNFYGPANDATLVNLRALNQLGIGVDSAIISAIDYAIQIKSTYNIRVLNLSLGRPVYESYKTDPLCQAVERAWKAGIVVVVAAGNFGRINTNGINGYSTVTSPGNDPYVITVGAINTNQNYDINDDTMTTYSSKGPSVIDQVVKPDLVAPGNRMISLQAPSSQLVTLFGSNRPATNVYRTDGTTALSSSYFKLSGTSMAAPMVSAAAALLVQQRPALTPDQVKAILMTTARKFTTASTTVYDATVQQTFTVQHDLFTVGAGILNVEGAINYTGTPSGSALSPIAYYDATAKKVYLKFNYLSGVNVIWGTTAFPTNVIWGTNVVWGTNVIWGTNVVWGTSGTNGFNVVWGTNSPWATTTLPSTEALSINGE